MGSIPGVILGGMLLGYLQRRGARDDRSKIEQRLSLNFDPMSASSPDLHWDHHRVVAMLFRRAGP